MEKIEPKQVGELISEFINSSKMGSAMMEGEAKEVFKSVAGEYVASFVEDVYVRNMILYVGVQSAVVRSDINLRKRFYINKVNEILGAKVIKNIVLK